MEDEEINKELDRAEKITNLFNWFIFWGVTFALCLVAFLKLVNIADDLCVILGFLCLAIGGFSMFKSLIIGYKILTFDGKS